MEAMTGREPGDKEQGALFEIEVDEEDGCVSIIVDGRVENLGPIDAVAEKWANWMAARDFDE
jgi:hypothetical protein